MGWLKDAHENNQGLTLTGVNPSYLNFMKWGNVNDEEAGLHEVWKDNGWKNLEYLKDRTDITTVRDLPKYEGKCCIMVGAGESLMKYWEDLKDLDDRFIIVATNSSAKFLCDRKIIPHYVIAIDGRPGDWTMNLGEHQRSITAIFSACTEPYTVKAWSGPVMIVPYAVPDEALKNAIQERFGEGIPSGGNAFNSAVAIFTMFTKIDTFLLLGNNLSFKDSYYADRKSRNDELAWFSSTDIFGNKVKTFIPLYEYKVWLENLIAQLYPDYYFCNCSEGILGVDVDGKLMQFIGQASIDVAIQDYKDAQKVLDMSDEEKNKLLYDMAFASGMYHPKNTSTVWEVMREHFEKPEKALDVGCGTGLGIKESRAEGWNVYGCDVAENRGIWEEHGIADVCVTAPAHNLPYPSNSFDFILCTEVMEHIPESLAEESLKEIYRVGSDKYIFTICLMQEMIPMCGGMVEGHVCIKEPAWWVEIFERIGYHVVSAYVDKGRPQLHSLVVYAVKDPTPYKDGKRLTKLDIDTSKLSEEWRGIINDGKSRTA